MTTPLPTYEDYLRDNGFSSEGMFVCPECEGPPQPAFALVKTPEGHVHPFICSNCHISEVQKERAEQEAIEAEERAEANPWDSDLGATVRAERNLKIERLKWALDPYTTPLNEAALERAREYVRQLHRITVDFLTPEEVTWPDEPTFGSGDYA